MGNVFSAIMAVKFVPLVLLVIFSIVQSNASQDYSLDDYGSFSLRSANCENSEPFLIKNRKKRKSYLTADLKTNAVNGDKKTGKANQQWIWSRCDNAIQLVNVATGGCLTSVQTESSGNIWTTTL